MSGQKHSISGAISLVALVVLSLGGMFFLATYSDGTTVVVIQEFMEPIHAFELARPVMFYVAAAIVMVVYMILFVSAGIKFLIFAIAEMENNPPSDGGGFSGWGGGAW